MMILEFMLQKTAVSPYNPDISLLEYFILGNLLTLMICYILSWTISLIPYLRIAIGEMVILQQKYLVTQQVKLLKLKSTILSCTL